MSVMVQCAVASPQQFDAERTQRAILADKRQALDFGLRDQESIERVAVHLRKTTGPQRVVVLDRERSCVQAMDGCCVIGHDAGGSRQLAEPELRSTQMPR